MAPALVSLGSGEQGTQIRHLKFSTHFDKLSPDCPSGQAIGTSDGKSDPDILQHFIEPIQDDHPDRYSHRVAQARTAIRDPSQATMTLAVRYLRDGR